MAASEAAAGDARGNSAHTRTAPPLDRMAPTSTRWTLGAKLAAVGLPFALLGLIATALTLWMSWQLDGGAAAINEAGRMRMQAYRLAWSSGRGVGSHSAAELIAEFDRSLLLLERGDTDRPLLTPWDDETGRRYQQVLSSWAVVRTMHASGAQPAQAVALDHATGDLVAALDRLVLGIEKHLSHYTNILHAMQVGLLVAGTIAAALLIVFGYHFVLEPVTDLKRAVSQLRSGDLATHVDLGSSDEFGELAIGFNEMANQLRASYADLEQRVRDKTAELQEKRERLQSLYDVSLLVSRSGTLEELASGFVTRARAATRSDAAALRWSDAGRQQFVLLASEGLPEAMAREEHCIQAGDCHCGRSAVTSGTRVIPIQALLPMRRRHCEQAGWATIVAVPILAHDRLIGELDLFYHAEYALSETENAMLETLTSHLASGMENLRLQSLERERAVADERAFLARELHDSIAQSLAFLGIQAQLMRKAMAEGDRERMTAALAEIELGLKESHGDVRELLVHFRTRTNAQDMEHALQSTLRKFEHQSGLATTFTVHDDGLPIAPDVQVQALHIVQEALSNVRKHAHAAHVWVDVWKRPYWRIAVRDDGRGFQLGALHADAENHVGLRIMRERAEKLGAALDISSVMGQGTTVRLDLPQPPMAAEAPQSVPIAEHHGEVHPA